MNNIFLFFENCKSPTWLNTLFHLFPNWLFLSFKAANLGLYSMFLSFLIFIFQKQNPPIVVCVGKKGPFNFMNYGLYFIITTNIFLSYLAGFGIKEFNFKKRWSAKWAFISSGYGPFFPPKCLNKTRPSTTQITESNLLFGGKKTYPTFYNILFFR